MPNSNTNQKAPLNQILYGPPGTGKTYNTIDKALKILHEYKEIESIPENREEKKKIFDRLKKLGQIQFITFHQSYSYEEFVEGIKPILDNDNKNEMTYKVCSGIFKEICEEAKKNQDISIDDEKTLWRLYTLPGGNDIFKECIENEQVWVYEADDIKDKTKNSIKSGVEGDYLVIPTASRGMSQTIRAFGVFGDFIEEKEEEGRKRLYRKVKWLWKDTSQEGVRLDVNFGRRTFQEVYETDKNKVLQAVKKNLKHKPHILIIDEINRGNISKIFGELITLIEPSKRIGNDEELKVTLPYSNEEFGVPKNLYIIGTMNTADRSIALLDTALRRRFEFIEMMPDSTCLKEEKIEGVELQELLNTMNERIEFLLDREHTIGHAYLIDVKTLDDLRVVFSKKIIPLLQEYFYDDYAKIDAVLNGNGMIKPYSMQDLKIKLNNNFADDEKRIYKITDSSTWDENTFLKIYSVKEQDTANES